MLPHVALVPAKPNALAKSRLSGLGDDVRRDLATAFARDVLAAVTDTPCFVDTVLVTDDDRLLSGWTGAVCPDAGTLNGSLVAAAAVARRRWPEAVPVAICADLPCVTPESLAFLADVAGPAFVPDHAGSGTAVYLAPYDAFVPRFGVESAAAHTGGGAQALPAPDALRRDVDTLADLAQARRLGVGRHTRAALAACGI